MNKVAQYLHTHMLGEITTDPSVLAATSTDASVLSITPDMVAYPRITNDIRKVARFAWQLAEKGHILPVIARGSGTDKTGAAIGKGIVLSFPAHMNRIFEYDAKQKLVRLQPGVTVSALKNALALQGTAIPELEWEQPQATLGGVVASSRRAKDYADQLEVVLSNGDTLQTKRISKRDVSKKKGQPGLEGDIYRNLDALLEDNAELIKEFISKDNLDHAGYHALALVKDKDGSMDLGPLFAGSQGTLGIISEMILKADYTNQTPGIMVAAFSDNAHARDAIDAIYEVAPTNLEYIDAGYFETAIASGKHFAFYDDAATVEPVTAVLVISINDFSQRTRTKKMKKLQKVLKTFGATTVFSDDETTSDLQVVRSIASSLLTPESAEESAPPLIDGVYVPLENFEAFMADINELAKKHHVELPLYGRPLEGLWYTRPILRLATVGDKQKVFKLIGDVSAIVAKHQGTLFGESGEGRLKNFAASQALSSELQDLFTQVRSIFDPQGILNTGVKQPSDIRELAKQLRSTYVAPSSSDYPARF